LEKETRDAIEANRHQINFRGIGGPKEEIDTGIKKVSEF
jgi:hypothetical protein